MTFHGKAGGIDAVLVGPSPVADLDAPVADGEDTSNE
jgi:hypothetical protein